MAKKVMTAVKGKWNAITEFAFEAATVAADGLELKNPARDEEVTILVYNSDESNDYDITVKAPTTGGYAASMSDMKLADLGEGEYAVIRLETAKWANRDGTILLVPENIAVKAVVLY